MSPRRDIRSRDLAELPRAPVILLDLTPRQVLAVCGGRLPAGYARRLREYRYGPGVFKLDWALSGPVPWRDPAVGGAATVHLGGTLGEIALAEAEVAAGRHPERPYVLAVQPCVADPSRAPGGKHVLWAYCHVPNGSKVDRTAAVEQQVERFAPGFRDLILARAAHDTAAMELHNPNLVGGDIAGGYSGLSQFVRRPRAGCALPVRPGVFKLDWALSGPVPWRDPAVGGAATVHLGGTLGEIARAEAEVAAGRHPDRPYVLAVQPCAADPSRAPGGQARALGVLPRAERLRQRT